MSLFCLLKPDCFVGPIKAETQDCLSGGVLPITLLEFFLRNGIIGIVGIGWEDVMYFSHCAGAGV
jgi:hypothetical protein